MRIASVLWVLCVALPTSLASASDIDKALKLGLNHPMGPFEMVDLVGLDARLNNLRALFEALGDLLRYSEANLLASSAYFAASLNTPESMDSGQYVKMARKVLEMQKVKGVSVSASNEEKADKVLQLHLRVDPARHRLQRTAAQMAQDEQRGHRRHHRPRSQRQPRQQ